MNTLAYASWDVSPYLVRVGSCGLRYYSVLFVLSLFAGFLLWRWQARRGGLDNRVTYSFATWAIVATIVGARLGHCLFYQPAYYLSHPVHILKVWQGGLASHGAIIGITLAVILFARSRGFGILEIYDRFSFSVTAGAAGVRLGNLFNSEIVGLPSSLPWAITYPRYEAQPIPRHPTQLYEFVLGLAVLGALVALDRRAGREDRPRGLLTGSAFVMYFTGRFLVEFFKEPIIRIGWLSIGQWLSVPGIMGGVAVLIWMRRQPPTSVGKNAAAAGPQSGESGNSSTPSAPNRRVDGAT